MLKTGFFVDPAYDPGGVGVKNPDGVGVYIYCGVFNPAGVEVKKMIRGFYPAGVGV